jgi:hypothetical protein
MPGARPAGPICGGRTALLALALCAATALAGTALLHAPMPASSAPPATTAGGEAVPHTHVAMAGMPGMGSGAAPVGGTAATAGGYTFVPERTTFPTGAGTTFAFQIKGPDGRPVTRFAIVHDKPLHLIVVRQDLSGYQHLHPTMTSDGTWSIQLRLPAPGTYRAYADFTAIDAKGTAAAVLGVDLTAPGPVARVPLPAPANASTVDGFRVTTEGKPVMGTVEPVLFRVSRLDGTPVTLQPYLGAYGHLVMLRTTDLGYLHIHPEPELAAGAVKFWVAAPGPGTYRVYLDFQVAGAVHVAEFTVTVA